MILLPHHIISDTLLPPNAQACANNRLQRRQYEQRCKLKGKYGWRMNLYTAECSDCGDRTEHIAMYATDVVIPEYTVHAEMCEVRQYVSLVVAVTLVE